MKKVIALISAVVIGMTLSSCTLEQAANTTADVVNSIETSESAEVKSVRNGYLTNYSSSVTVGDALGKFLSNPRWQYFKAESGEEIVQCTGGCVYQDQNVEAKIQFQLNADNTFQIYALAFNDISQNMLMTAAFFEKVYEGVPTSTSTYETVSISEPEPNEGAPIINDNATNTYYAYSSSESYLDTYRLNTERFYPRDMMGMEQMDVRFLLNALYAYHGYTFEGENFRRFYGRKSWYTPMGKSMEQCEREFNEVEMSNKNELVDYEKRMGWR